MNGSLDGPTLTEALDDCPAGGTAWLTFPEAGEALSVGDVRDSADRVAAGLGAIGVRRGDVVGLLVAPGGAVPICLFGIWRAGATVSVLPTRAAIRLDSQVEHVVRIVDKLGLRHLIADRAHAELAESIVARRPVVTVLDPAELASTTRRPPMNRVGPDDLAVVQFTSGSTSTPKGVLLTHGTVMAGLRAIVESAAVTSADVFAHWVPHYHDMGLFAPLAFALAGCPVHWFSPIGYLRDPHRFVSYFADCGGTATAGPNFNYDLITDSVAGSARMDLRRWRLAFNGAEPVSVATCRRFADTFRTHGVGPGVMYPVYGMAEVTLAATFPQPGAESKVVDVDRESLANRRVAVPADSTTAAVKSLVSVGRPVLGMRLRVVDEQGEQCATGLLGEIQLTGDAVTSGYLRDAAATAAVFDGEWLRTGDLGVLLDGELFVTGRSRDMVIVNGQNYFAEDVEALAAAAPGVHRRHAVSFASAAQDGAEYAAVVVEAARGTDAGELAALVRRRVADDLGLRAVRVFVVPPRWLPRTTSGKWQRAATRDMIERKEAVS